MFAELVDKLTPGPDSEFEHQTNLYVAVLFAGAYLFLILVKKGFGPKVAL